MEAILTFLQKFSPEKLAALGIDIWFVLKIAGVVLVGTFAVGLIGKFVFGKGSVLSTSLSSAIGILFVYAVTVSLQCAGASIGKYLAPLPFVRLSGDQLVLFPFHGALYTDICTQLLRMIVLSFLVNLADRLFPRGKNFFTWLLLRCLTVILALVLHLVVTGLLAAYLPQELLTYAPVILLGVLALMLLTGALKFVVGAFLTTVNPMIAALYTFFFANIIGKQITKAVFTTGLLTGLVLILQNWGIPAIPLATAALAAYIPFAVALIALWYLICRIFK